MFRVCSGVFCGPIVAGVWPCARSSNCRVFARISQTAPHISLTDCYHLKF